MTNIVVQERVDEKGQIHRIEIPLATFLAEHNFEAVVRCKDCKWWAGCNLDTIAECSNCGGDWKANEYCSCGEKRKEG